MLHENTVHLFLQMRLKNHVLAFYCCSVSKVFTYSFHHRAKCKNTDILEETAHHVEVNPDNGAKSITASSVTSAMILCLSLLLVPCKCSLSFNLVYIKYRVLIIKLWSVLFELIKHCFCLRDDRKTRWWSIRVHVSVQHCSEDACKVHL